MTEVAYAEQFDILIATCLDVAPYLLNVPDKHRFLEEHNFYTLWMHDLYKSQTNPMKKLARWVSWQKCWRYEKRLYPKFDGISMVSDRDFQAVKTTIPEYGGRIEVIPNGVDLETHNLGQPSLFLTRSYSTVH